MTLGRRCVELKEQLLELRGLEKEAGETSAFQEMRDLLYGELERLRPLHMTMQLFEEKVDIELIDLPIEDAHQLSNAFGKAQSGFRADPGSMTKAAWLRDVVFSLPAFASRIKDSLTRSWEAYTSRHSPNLDVRFLEVLASVPTLASIVSDIRRLQSEVDSLRGRLPKTDQDMQTFHSKIDQLNRQWHALTGEGIPDGVITFLRDCGVSGANLDLLTDEVLDWLSVHDMTTSFCVVIRRNA